MCRGSYDPSTSDLAPGFPVELGGFGKLHAPFLTERRTRGLLLRCVAGNPGSGPRVLAEGSAWLFLLRFAPLVKTL
jgi:hypothetical protein